MVIEDNPGRRPAARHRRIWRSDRLGRAARLTGSSSSSCDAGGGMSAIANLRATIQGKSPGHRRCLIQSCKSVVREWLYPGRLRHTRVAPLFRLQGGTVEPLPLPSPNEKHVFRMFDGPHPLSPLTQSQVLVSGMSGPLFANIILTSSKFAAIVKFAFFLSEQLPQTSMRTSSLAQ